MGGDNKNGASSEVAVSSIYFLWGKYYSLSLSLMQIYRNAASYKNKATVVLHARRLHDRLVQLAHRSLVEVTGKDAGRFLQGLTTADVLVPTSLAQYSLFLNHQGRVLYDTIIYHTGRESMLIECDRRASESFVKHLTRYRLRTKVSWKYCIATSFCGQKIFT